MDLIITYYSETTLLDNSKKTKIYRKIKDVRISNGVLYVCTNESSDSYPLDSIVDMFQFRR